MRIKKYNKFSINESESKSSKLNGEITLYRLSSHKIINLLEPGNFYVTTKSKLNTDFLKKKTKELYLITVKCDSSNIDIDKSEIECAKLNCDYIVVVKDDKKCELVKVEPFSK